MATRTVRTLVAFVLAGCSAGMPPPPTVPAPAAPTTARWIPQPGTSYQIQYDGRLDLRVPADIYDLDGFQTRSSVVARLHRMGRRVNCYIDVGTWENWRPDAGQFPKSVLGKRDGPWPGERWLDIRQRSILEPIMGERFDICRRKGFDGVDPDNIDGYQNDTGFPLTAAEQLTYDEWVARAVHARGLTVDQKNDNNQVKELSKFFDFAVLEQCYIQGWCDQFGVYTRTNRLVVDVEYGLRRAEFLDKTCRAAERSDDTAIDKRLELTAWIITCPPFAKPRAGSH
jgi:hypothetical protein